MIEKIKALPIVQAIKDRKFLEAVAGVAVILLITLIYFAPDIFDGNVLRQHDTVQGIANGQEVKQF
ncbi:MAG: hypothetical protein PUC77_02845, partial [Bacteroidales bacterium]|nr:hypothetical protein [Bacteroidales bacterium]